jgi:hypothetical protein
MAIQSSNKMLYPSDEGELSITFASFNPRTYFAAKSRMTAANPQTARESLPVAVHMEHSLKNPVDGSQFVLPSGVYPFVSLFY